MSISGCGFERGGDGGGEAVAVDRERAAGRHLVGVGRAHDQRAEPAHLLMQQADRVGLASSERNEFEQTSSASASVLCAAVIALGPHFVQDDRHAAPRRAARRPPSRRGRRR